MPIVTTGPVLQARALFNLTNRRLPNDLGGLKWRKLASLHPLHGPPYDERMQVVGGYGFAKFEQVGNSPRFHYVEPTASQPVIVTLEIGRTMQFD